MNLLSKLRASRPSRALKNWANAGLSSIYPDVCQLCGHARATPGESFVCAGCRAETRFIEPPFCDRCGRPVSGAITGAFTCANCKNSEPNFSFARSAVAARDKTLDAIHRYKYSRALWFEPFLGGLLVARAQPQLAQGQWDWIVPVPLHPVRQREREFNQAERLGACLSGATGIALNPRLLRRTVATRTQTLLSREERLENVRRAFAMRDRARLSGERIVVIDDVFTTGATTDACAGVLRKAGAAEVCVWTLGRGI